MYSERLVKQRSKYPQYGHEYVGTAVMIEVMIRARDLLSVNEMNAKWTI